MIWKREKKEKETPNISRGKSILPGSILIALFASVIIFVVMLNAEKNALSSYEKGNILVALKAIPEGEMITENNVAAYFSGKEMDKSLIPETALTSMEQMIGKLPVLDIDAGTILTQGMFEDVNVITKDMLNPVIAGFKAEDLYQVVSGTLRAGDRIHIYVIDEESDTVPIIWQDVFVHQVFDTSGNVIQNSDKLAAAQRVNIILEKDSTEQFYSLLTSGALRVVKAWE